MCRGMLSRPPPTGAGTGRRVRARASRKGGTDQGSCWPSAMTLDHLRPRPAEHHVGHRGPELADDDLGLGEDQNLLVERQLFRLDGDEAERLQGLDHLRAVGRCCGCWRGRGRPRRAWASPRTAPPCARWRGFAAKACLCCGWAFWLLDAAMAVADDGVLQKDRPRPDFANEPGGDVEPRDQRPLPGFQRPGQHRDAHRRAEMDQGDDVEQIVPEIRLLGIGDQEMLAGNSSAPARAAPGRSDVRASRPAARRSTIALTEERKPSWNGPRNEWRQTKPRSEIRSPSLGNQYWSTRCSSVSAGASTAWST